MRASLPQHVATVRCAATALIRCGARDALGPSAAAPPPTSHHHAPMTQLGTPVEWIDTPRALVEAAARWRAAAAVGIDSEFVRERTFYPRLGLLQVSDGAR